VAVLQFPASTKRQPSPQRSGASTDTNSPVVDGGAITNLQIAAGCDLNLSSLLLLHHPQLPKFNDKHPPSLGTVASAQVVDRNLMLWVSIYICCCVQILANTRQSTTFNLLTVSWILIDWPLPVMVVICRFGLDDSNRGCNEKS
jgi:hypothetical protein